MVAVDGEVIGQVNALAVYEIGEFLFGRPVRITAETYLGKQGVIIPCTNTKNLMLKKEVIDAVRHGKFHIHANSTVEESIEVLTGLPAGQSDVEGNFLDGTVYGVVQQKLKKISGTFLSTQKRIRC